MPYGMTQTVWEQRYQNRVVNPIIQTVACPRVSCKAHIGEPCWTRLGNIASDVHLTRIQSFMRSRTCPD